MIMKQWLFGNTEKEEAMAHALFRRKQITVGTVESKTDALTLGTKVNHVQCHKVQLRMGYL